MPGNLLQLSFDPDEAALLKVHEEWFKTKVRLAKAREIRNHAIVGALNQGLSRKEAARITGLTEGRISQIVNQYAQRGD